MTRLVSGVVLAAAAVAAILFLPVEALRVIVAGVAVLAAYEYLRIVDREAPIHWPALAAVVALYWLVSSGPVHGVLLLAVGMALVAADVLFRGRTVGAAAAAMLAPAYIGAPLGILVSLHAARGRTATLLVLATVVLSDSAQYYTGRAFGRRPLAPVISPKKTVEGALGGLVLGTLFVALAGPWVSLSANAVAYGALGAAAVILGICGDLFESTLKRAAGLKDSSALIPGHGGVLDRIDALLFVIPAFFLFWTFRP